MYHHFAHPPKFKADAGPLREGRGALHSWGPWMAIPTVRGPAAIPCSAADGTRIPCLCHETWKNCRKQKKFQSWCFRDVGGDPCRVSTNHLWQGRCEVIVIYPQYCIGGWQARDLLYRCFSSKHQLFGTNHPASVFRQCWSPTMGKFRAPNARISSLPSNLKVQNWVSQIC